VEFEVCPDGVSVKFEVCPDEVSVEFEFCPDEVSVENLRFVQMRFLWSLRLSR
jgi:hypothetical protein